MAGNLKIRLIFFQEIFAAGYRWPPKIDCGSIDFGENECELGPFGLLTVSYFALCLRPDKLLSQRPTEPRAVEVSSETTATDDDDSAIAERW